MHTRWLEWILKDENKIYIPLISFEFEST